VLFRSEVVTKVTKIVAEQLQVDESKVVPEAINILNDAAAGVKK
jgi:hypothetical protein